MLGQDSKELPIVTGRYAEEMRDALRRAHLNQPNDADQRTQIRAAQIMKKYHVVWKQQPNF